MKAWFTPHRRERGVALIVSLIILVVVTLIGLSGIQIASQEERMSANAFDRSIGFQGAEAALREGEEKAKAGTSFPTTACDCNAEGLCAPPNDTCSERWLSDSTVWKEIPDEVNLGALATKPSYIVEHLGSSFPCKVDDAGSPPNCKRYRITARSGSGSDRAVVILQSIYATE